MGCSSSVGNAPKPRNSGSEGCRGAVENGIEAVAVADDAVAEDCEAPNCSVAEDTVFGDVAVDVAPKRIALSPPVGPVPR